MQKFIYFTMSSAFKYVEAAKRKRDEVTSWVILYTEEQLPLYLFL